MSIPFCLAKIPPFYRAAQPESSREARGHLDYYFRIADDPVEIRSSGNSASSTFFVK